MIFRLVYRILVAILPFVALCSAASSDTSNGASASSLLNTIPECAQHCVENFIKSEYTPTECTAPSNVNCLCQTQTPSGLTLGEAAFSCILSMCTQDVIASSNSSSAYRICDSVPGALPETHATITATVFSNVHSTATADAPTTSGTSTSNNTLETSFTPSTSTASGIFPHPTTYYSSLSEPEVQPAAVNTGQSPWISSHPSSAAQKKEAHQTISPGAVIGVSVSSGMAGSFIIGVAVFFCCKRWRRRNQSESDDDLFDIGGDMSEPANFSQPLPCYPRSFPSNTSGVHQEASRSTDTIPPKSQYPPRFGGKSDEHRPLKPRDREPIGLAISSTSDWEASPRTLSSQHTLTELLPDQTAGLCPKPLKWSHRPSSGETLFEEDEGQPPVVEENQDATQGPKTQNMMAGLPPHPRAWKDGFPASRFLRDITHQRSKPNRTSPGTFVSNNTVGRSSGSKSKRVSNGNSKPSHHPLAPNALFNAPLRTGQGRVLSGMSPSRKPPPPQAPTLPSGALGPHSEIVSRPRIVRANNIKRVQIGRSPHPPSQVVVPYCPEDFWLERGRARGPPQPASTEPPYPSDSSPSVVPYPSSPRKQKNSPKRLSLTSRNLTPSRRGADMILDVE